MTVATDLGILCKECPSAGSLPQDCTLIHNHYWDIYTKKIRPGDYWVALECGHKQRLFAPIPKTAFGEEIKVYS